MPPTTRSKRKHQQAELEKGLLRCAAAADLHRVRDLILIDRVNVNCSDGKGVTPLHWASLRNHVNVARFLLENGANVDAFTVRSGRYTALMCAILRGNVALAELFLEYGASMEIRCHAQKEVGTSCSPLGVAIFRGNVGMVALLLRFGARTEETIYKDQRRSALQMACYVCKVEIVQLLLEHDGVDVNAITPKSSASGPAMSALCVACRRDRLDIARLLVQKGAQVIYDGPYPDSPCPLVHAINKGSLDLVKLLLENSPFSKSANDKKKNTPHAETGTRRPLFAPLLSALRGSNLDAAQLLLDHGIGVNDAPFLSFCAGAGCCTGARFLLRAGANVNQRCKKKNGMSPLGIATAKGNVELVQEFLKAGANVNMRDNNGETPIGLAHRKRYNGIVFLLLRTSPHVWSRLEEFLVQSKGSKQTHV